MASGEVVFPLSSPPAYPGTALTAALNAAFLTTLTQFSSGAAPTSGSTGLTSLGGIFWHNTANNTINIRNLADTAWITIGSLDEVNGVFSANYRDFATVTSGYSIPQTIGLVRANASGAPFAVGLPTIVASSGRTVSVQKIDSSTNQVTVSGDASIYFGGSAYSSGIVLTFPGQSVTCSSVNDPVSGAGWNLQADGADIIALPSTAAMVALGIVAPLYPNVIVTGEQAATFNWVSGSLAAADGGSVFASTGVASGRYFRQFNNGLAYFPENYGCSGNAMVISNAIITGVSASTSSYTFVASDIGKTWVGYLCGASGVGRRNLSFISPIANVVGGVAILASGVTNNVLSAGVMAWGTDDTAAMQSALSAAASGALILSRSYFMTGAFNIGSGSATWCHNIICQGRPSLVFAIASSGIDAVEMLAYNGTDGYRAMNILGTLTIDNMGTARDNMTLRGGYKVFRENMTYKRAFRNGSMYQTDSNNYIQHVLNVNTQIEYAGLNALMAFANCTVSGNANGFIDEVAHYGLDIESWGENPPLAASGASGIDCGTGLYFLAVGASGTTDNFIEGWTFSGPLEINAARSISSGYGAQQNLHACVWSDGNQAHPVWGSGITQTDVFSRFTIIAPQIEDSTGEAQSSGAVFALLASGQTPTAMLFENTFDSGGWANLTSGFSFSANTANGNSITSPNAPGNTPIRQEGFNYNVGQVLANTSSGSTLLHFGANNSKSVLATSSGVSIMTNLNAAGKYIIRDDTAGGLAELLWDHYGSQLTVNTALANISFSDSVASGLVATATGGASGHTLSVLAMGPAS